MSIPIPTTSTSTMFTVDCNSLVLLGTSVNSNLRPLGLNGYFSPRFIVMTVHLDLFSAAAVGYKFFMKVLQDQLLAFREFTMIN